MRGNRLADDLGDERHGARGARVDLENVDYAVLDGELHVHQADDLERQGQLARLAVELGERRGAERMRRQRAGAVARMDARLLDVLHDARRRRCPCRRTRQSTSTSTASAR